MTNRTNKMLDELLVELLGTDEGAPDFVVRKFQELARQHGDEDMWAGTGLMEKEFEDENM